ncbi:UDP-N-acetylglucosamine 2-epimerase [Rossellomorea sp. LjRoot5]|uniref:UDP-N-acetylglucosamine 2-epimerase n=1 Tax=Rossellomorea sp. LjRoot5 TaxID=3342331 RepID=UPI003ECD4940
MRVIITGNRSSEYNAYKINDLLSLKDIEDIENRAYLLSDTWFEGNPLKYNNINFSRLSQLYTYKYFEEILTLSKIYRNIMQLDMDICYLYSEEPKRLYKLFETVSNYSTVREIEFKLETLVSNGTGEKKDYKKYLIDYLKMNFMDNLVKYFYSFIGSKSNKVKKKPSKILIFADVYNKPTNEMLNQVFNNLLEEDKLIVASEKRIINEFFFKGNSLGQYFHVKDIFKASTQVYKMNKKINKLFEKIMVNENLNFFEMENAIILDKSFINFFKKISFSSLLDHIVLNRLLNIVSPKLIVLGTDCHKLSRHISMISNQNNISTLVVQHGATNGKFGFSPLIADNIAVWGNISKKTLIEWGVAAESIHITGNPRYEEYKKFNNDISINKIHNDNKQLVFLLALSPYETDTMNEILELVLKYFTKTNNKVILKPHPSDKNLQIYRDNVNKFSNGNFILDTTSSTETLLARSDGVITAQSTIGIEALILGKPLIEVNSKRIQVKIPYIEYNCCYTISNEQELEIAINSIFDKDSNCRIKSKNAEKFVNDYIGEENSFSKLNSLISSILQKRIIGKL